MNLGAAIFCAFVVVAISRETRAGGKAVDGVVNLNTAPPELLSLLPGVGPSKARGIVSYRTRHLFRTVDELVRVKGIGRRMVRGMRSHLAVSGPSTAHGAAGGREDAVPTPAPVAPAPASRVSCRPVGAIVLRPALPARFARSPQSRPIRSWANHCAPPK
jgi:competence ComEA-like helix-hairpin-helix protein